LILKSIEGQGGKLVAIIETEAKVPYVNALKKG
jgi:hypothetical protein